MSRRFILPLLIVAFFLWGCPPKMMKTPPETSLSRNPLVRILEAFSLAENLQAKTSIRIHVVRSGEDMVYILNGFLLYERPDKLRLLGYHPFGMGLFDALYLNGDFSLLVPLQKRVYTGEVSQFEDLMEKAGPIEISTEKEEGNDIPSRIQIRIPEKEIDIELRLRNVSMNANLPEDSFQWKTPEGIEVKPLAQLLRKKKLR